MGNYGLYGFKPYTSKKGKQWYQNSSKFISEYGSLNSHYKFTDTLSAQLEEIERNNKKFGGLLPFAPIPKNNRYSDSLNLYFAIEDDYILSESLKSIMSIPFLNQDIIAVNKTNLSIVDYDEFGNPKYDYSSDIFNTIMTRDSLTRGYLNNKILAFCFEYILPNCFTYDLSIYFNMIDAIKNCVNFRDRTMLIRSDIVNNRVLFIVSNVIEDFDSLEKYKRLYNQCNLKQYKGLDILFTRHPEISYNTLESELNSILYCYIDSVLITIKNKINNEE